VAAVTSLVREAMTIVASSNETTLVLAILDRVRTVGM